MGFNDACGFLVEPRRCFVDVLYPIQWHQGCLKLSLVTFLKIRIGVIHLRRPHSGGGGGSGHFGFFRTGGGGGWPKMDVQLNLFYFILNF